jgi:hypothetical protein
MVALDRARGWGSMTSRQDAQPSDDAAVLARQDDRQARAGDVMADLDLMARLGRVGVPTHSGSSALGIMVALDIDVTTLCPSLDLGPIFAFGEDLAAHPRVRSLTFRNETGHWNTGSEYVDGLYWKVGYVSDDDAVWSLDLWFLEAGTTQYDLIAMETLPARLDDSKRATIVRIKEALADRTPRVRGYQVIDGVLDHDVRTADALLNHLAADEASS